jgi:hypothetical protein
LHAIAYVPNIFDYGLTFVGVVLATLEVRLFSTLWRGDPAGSARMRAYVYFIAYQWALVGCIVALWIADKRPWSALLLRRSNTVGRSVGLAMAAAYLSLAIFQYRAILHRPETFDRVRHQLGAIEPLLPHDVEHHTPGSTRGKGRRQA